MTSLVLRLTSDASLRGIIQGDGTHLFSVYDFITIACQKKDDGAYARKTYSNLVKDSCEFKKEVVKSVLYCQFPGARQRETPAMTIRGLQRLLMILGGKVAANFRTEVEGTFTRVMAGDTSLIQEIRDNAVSTSPVHQVFRQALVEEPISDEDEVGRKRQKRMEEREDALFAIEMKERNMRCIKEFSSIMTDLNPSWKEDARLRLQVEDSLKTTVLSKANLQIENGVVARDLMQSISVSQVAQEMGVQLNHSDSIAIGKKVAKAYKEQYGEKPSKHRQWVDGAEREVNSYTEKDRGILEAAIKEQAMA